ncbi:MAG TPA: hypothetical protein VGB76_10160 [Pyrinomonadaceae bacterium]|jgi:hypothetical protein
MTGEEMERAIEFLLQSQAKAEAQIAETARQIAETQQQAAETQRQAAAYAETQSVFIQTVTRALEAQDQINASLRAADARTDERLNKLIGLFEQHIKVGH